MIDSQRGAAIIISYPTSASGIIVLLKTPQKYRKLDYNKNKKAQKITHTLAIFVDHGIMPQMKTLELHYPMIQFLINVNTCIKFLNFKTTCMCCKKYFAKNI